MFPEELAAVDACAAALRQQSYGAAFSRAEALRIAGSCSRWLRINTAGSVINHFRVKKFSMRELSWHPSSPLPPHEAFKAGRADTRPRVHLRQPVAPSPALSVSRLRWLWPRRHAEHEHFAQRPDVIGQARGYGRRPRRPLLRGARADRRYWCTDWR